MANRWGNDGNSERLYFLGLQNHCRWWLQPFFSHFSLCLDSSCVYFKQVICKDESSTIQFILWFLVQLSFPIRGFFAELLEDLISYLILTSVQFSWVTQSCLTLFDPWTAAHQASLSITNSRSLLKLMSIKLVMPSNHLILCHPLLLLPSIFPSIRVFSNESVLRIRWPKCWSFSFSISPSNEYSGLISFRMDWLDLLAVQGTLKSLLQHHTSKASILRCSVFFFFFNF